MSDQQARTPDQFVKRSPTLASTTGYSLGTGVGVAAVHFAFKCFKAHQFMEPDDALIEVAIFAVLPVIQFIVKCFGLLGDIITNRLRKAAGES